MVAVVGVMTPPSLAGASEAVNQEMETTPSRAPGRALSFTRCRYVRSGHRAAIEWHLHLTACCRLQTVEVEVVRRVSKRWRGVKAVAAGGGVEIP